MNADEANRLADELGLIPKNVNTLIQADATAAVRAAEEALRAIGAIPTYRHVTIDGSVTSAFESASKAAANSNFVSLRKAAGGYISGPGTTTSDSIPARLSNGEYVVKASSVQKYGRSFFDSVNAQRFAAGGYVGGGSVSVSSNPQVAVYVQSPVDGSWIRQQARVVVREEGRNQAHALTGMRTA